jgi:hypothetical protein
MVDAGMAMCSSYRNDDVGASNPKRAIANLSFKMALMPAGGEEQGRSIKEAPEMMNYRGSVQVSFDQPFLS